MVTMTKYLESLEVQTEENTPILEQFMMLQTAAVELGFVMENMAIYEFCTESGIGVPDIVKEAYDSFSDAVNSFLDNVVDFIMGLVRSIIGYCNKVKLARIINALDDAKDDITIPKEIVLNSQGIELSLHLIDELALILNEIDSGEPLTGQHRQDIVKRLELITEFKTKNLETYQKGYEIAKANNADYYHISKDASGNTAYHQTIMNDSQAIKHTKEEVVEELRKIVALDIPVRGKKILERLKYSKAKLKKASSGDKIDKEIMRLIRKAANTAAYSYDNDVKVFITSCEKLCKELGIKLSDAGSTFRGVKEGSDTRNGRDQSKPLSNVTNVLRGKHVVKTI